MAGKQAFREYANTQDTITELIRQLNHYFDNLATNGYVTIAPNSVKDTMIDFGSGVGQVNASDIPNVPAGNISATTVQAAINELDTEKEPTVTKGNLTAASSKVTVTGGTNAVIGFGTSLDISEANVSHNNLGSKQGGTSGQYYHITSAQFTSFGNGITQSFTIPDKDAVHYHHFTISNGIMTSYVYDTNP